MSNFKRAWYYITRKKMKTLIMFCVLFAIATATISGISIKKATDVSKEQINNSIKPGFSLSHNLETVRGFGERGFGNVPYEVIEEIMKQEEVEQVTMRIINEIDLVDTEKIEKKDSDVFLDESITTYAKVLDLESMMYSEMDDKFESGILSLTEGKHIQPNDKQIVMVHETFAKINGIKLHDILKVKSSKLSTIPKNENSVEDVMNLEVVGFFTGQNAPNAKNSFDLVENVLIADLDTGLKLRGTTFETAVYQNASFVTKSTEDLNKIIQKIPSLSFDENNYTIEKSNDKYPSLSGSLDLMDRLIRNLIVGIIVIGDLILSLVLAFWIQGRIHETGVLLALGKSKLNIVSQYVIELLMIAILAFGMSFFSGKLVAQKIGDSFVKEASTGAQNSFNQQLGGMMFGGNPESNTVTKTIDSIDVNITLQEMVGVWAIGSLIILISVGASSMFIIRLKPREILSKMS